MAPSDRCRGIYLSNSAVSKLTDESMKWAERKPIGIRFNPKDQVLAGIFLVRKVFGRTADSPVFQFFRDVNVYDHEPSKLSGLAHEFGEGKMYFFTTIKKKRSKGRTIIERTVRQSGCWKKTGKPSSIDDVIYENQNLSVTKTSLVFCEKNGAQQKKTQWLMKEYMLDLKIYEGLGMSDPLVLCVVYWNEDGKKDQCCENWNGSGDDASKQISVPNMVEGSSPISDITDSSSLPPTKQNDPNPCCQPKRGMHSALDNPSKRRCLGFHILPEISESLSINYQLDPGSNLGLPQPIAARQSSLHEPAVSETRFPIQDADQSQDSLFDSLLIDRLQFMEPQSCENPISAVTVGPSSGVTAKTNLLDQYQISVPNMVKGSSPMSDITDSSSLLHPIQNDPNLSMHFPHDNPRKPHFGEFPTLYEIPDSFSINYQPDPGSNLGLPEPIAAHQSSLPQPAVSGTPLLIPHAGQSRDSLFGNLLVDRSPFMNQDPQSRENPISAVIAGPSSGVTANTNLLAQHQIMDPNRPLFSPVTNEPFMFHEHCLDDSWLQKIVNEHGSNQHQQPEPSLDRMDQIAEEPSNYEMTCNLSEQQPAGMTPMHHFTAIEEHFSLWDQFDPMKGSSWL